MGRAFEARRAGKEKRWGEMSRLYPKLGKVITMAAKAGGSDPESNTALKTAVNNAKAQNMLKTTLRRLLSVQQPPMLQTTMKLVTRVKAHTDHFSGWNVPPITPRAPWQT